VEHTERRSILRKELAQLEAIMLDSPGLLAPKFEVWREKEGKRKEG
jgi:hypothetical protein